MRIPLIGVDGIRATGLGFVADKLLNLRWRWNGARGVERYTPEKRVVVEERRGRNVCGGESGIDEAINGLRCVIRRG